MFKFKEIFESTEMDSNNVYWDKNTSRWGIDSDILKFSRSFGGKLKAVFVTADNHRQGKLAERWCFAADELKYNDFPSPGSGYEVLRYISKTTLSGEMAPLIAINPNEGKVKFVKDLNADIKDMKWDKPLKVQYMRYIK